MHRANSPTIRQLLPIKRVVADALSTRTRDGR
jgi:hypothetical protein